MKEQNDFLPVNDPVARAAGDERLADVIRYGDHMAGLTREQALAYLRHPLSEAEAARYETILHDDPLPRPAGWEDRALPDEPTGPVSPTLLAASWRAGQKRVDGIGAYYTPPGLMDAPADGTGATENGVSARASEDGRDWRQERLQARTDVRQRVQVKPDTLRLWDGDPETIDQRALIDFRDWLRSLGREARLAVYGFGIVAFCAVGGWLLFLMFGRGH